MEGLVVGFADLLCIDELGRMELDRRGAELLFQVLTEREEKNSVAIASSESFSGWTETFPDPGSARPSSTASPSMERSSRPAPSPIASPTPKPWLSRPPLAEGEGRRGQRQRVRSAVTDFARNVLQSASVALPPCLVTCWHVVLALQIPNGCVDELSHDVGVAGVALSIGDDTHQDVVQCHLS
jgi:hypothetical protein